MTLRYYDHTEGRERIKPRYKWATVAFAVGMLVGIIVAHVL